MARQGDGHADARGWLAEDWIVRTHTPPWLRLAGLDAEADGLESLPEIVSLDTLQALDGKLDAARARAGQAAFRNAANDALGAAAGFLAWQAIRSARGAAAGGDGANTVMAVARAALWELDWPDEWFNAWGFGREAAGGAAWDAAWNALKPTTLALQDSALELFSKMVLIGSRERNRFSRVLHP